MHDMAISEFNKYGINYAAVRIRFTEAYEFMQTLNSIVINFYGIPNSELLNITDVFLMQNYIDLVDSVKVYLGISVRKRS